MTATTTRPGGSVRERPPGRRRPRRRFTGRDRHDFWVFLALVLPNVALIIAFAYRPVLANLQYSLLNWTLGSPTATFIGLDNYVRFLTSPSSATILWTTLVFTVVTVGGSMVLGLLIALALNRRVPGTGVARAAVFSPFVLSGVGVGLVWLFVFDPTIGVLGSVLRTFGGTAPDFFNNPTLSLVMICVVYVWKNMGYAAVIYLAGLQSIPRDLLEASALDGASPTRTFFKVVLPLLSPTTFFLLVTSVLNSLQAFDLIRIMTPLGRGTTTLIYEAYLQAFGGYNRGGYSAAVSTILFALLVVFTLVQLRWMEKRVHYA
ncbi:MULTISPECIES: carbohydrate ABC transporter permease [Pseudonocardia]|uniref:sn-glycerol-3-phosphate transport system permease protein UgpA n=2 Tax=Pseudonocardia TaxID=1847 RepID=A0A1Y2MYX7_PSEAH|nr:MULTISPECIES: sugar ABC transporter permease [Pseudonocardia]OSY40385.1 sn-glycerol-3-phosphate transport system permease protein UgpA [Pseudonocardia autotrophica]TDN72284.1 carbohydrate ABC transporter membrane protein 1 (CUT1 family) [Pseudonocardia autotrophica]BBG02996.1 glycerol-3-phosphate ABC transporter permease [Pseudonocardia autotrophica]GEC25102.1 glycerol-3-phosphate ABC transporter permease [Pseudonocardia saturnea]